MSVRTPCATRRAVQQRGDANPFLPDVVGSNGIHVERLPNPG